MVKTTTTDGHSRMPPTPSSIMSDALAAFSKAANHAIGTAEKHAAAEVARVTAEAEDMRRERDEAVDALNAIRLEKKDWQRRLEGWKTSADKANMTIEHQNETIAQLREEASQWKGQLLRYEDTSRREAQDWKEQYLRAEQERIRLAARVDELVGEQLAWNTHTNANNPAYTARYSELPAGMSNTRVSTTAQQRPIGSRSVPPTFDEHEPQPETTRKKSASTKPTGSRGDTSSRPRSPVPVAGPSTSRTPKKKAGAIVEGRAEQTLATRPSAAPRASMSSQQFDTVRVIRRVQAVVEVPVKEESDDDGEGLLSDEDEDEYKSQTKTAQGKTPQKPKARRRSSVKAKKVVSSDDDDYEPDPPPSVRRRQQVDQDSDDELAIGIEDNRHELYGTQRVVVTSEKNTPQRQRTATSTRPSTNTKKRKLDGDTSAAARGTASKLPRK
ncbi:hypothetical protein BXZ70DRAFT_922151 [Cristinia sonorae]|uniref:Uncharacterized protein n=1 Tax=Cristinia sonorae TaxID=1940300 RepID=A0A8K0XT72_9AGAR|nr:hypothetical protein BXZ70DRAFT_922151 [Cristinia sonorae]